MADALTPKQQRFVEEYLIDANATKAAQRAGYSKATAYAQGQRLLKNVEVAAALKEAMEDRGRRTQVTADKVLAELARIGFSNVEHFSAGDTGLSLAEGAPADAMRAVSSVKRRVVTRSTDDGEEVDVTVEFRLWDKVSALEKMAKHLGILTDRVEHGATGDLIAVVLAAAKRDAA
jgi:phage terminase small subunit